MHAPPTVTSELEHPVPASLLADGEVTSQPVPITEGGNEAGLRIPPEILKKWETLYQMY